MKNKIFSLIILGAGVLSGCAYFSPVKPGAYINHSERFKTYIASQDWQEKSYAHTFLITKDGESLNYIRVHRQKLDKELQHTKQRFVKDMNPYELAEVERASIKSRPLIVDFKVIGDRPATIDGHPGYRLEYAYRTHLGLDRQGIRYGFIHEKWIYRIQYEASKEYYFNAHQDDFGEFIANFKVF